MTGKNNKIQRWGFDNDNLELLVILPPRSRITIICPAIDAEKNLLVNRTSCKSGDEPSRLEAARAITILCCLGMAAVMGISWSALWLAPYCWCLLRIILRLWSLRLAFILGGAQARALARFLVYLSVYNSWWNRMCEARGTPVKFYGVHGFIIVACFFIILLTHCAYFFVTDFVKMVVSDYRSVQSYLRG